MKVLHVVKTADGALWAAKLAARLCDAGVDVHVALPRLEGRALDCWQRSGATLHACNLDLPARRPWELPAVIRRARRLVAEVSPNLIHSHFVGTTLVLRLSLGKKHSIPRIFQVPGPLHLEHALFRRMELDLAGGSDYWIGSSRCIVEHYLRAGVSRDRVFLSYYGDEIASSSQKNDGELLRRRVGARAGELLVGSISWMYPPKRYLGQHTGLKGHEDLIEALGLVCRADSRVRGVLAGAGWGGAERYERRLKKLAHQAAGDRIVFTGALPLAEAREAWRDLDLAVHVPISENCGGVIEPLLQGVPVIASRVGGLPEVIYEGVTGTLVRPRDPQRLAEAILHGLAHLRQARESAGVGQQLVRDMFDVERTAREVDAIYRHILSGSPRPPEFDSCMAAARIMASQGWDADWRAPKHKTSGKEQLSLCPR